MNYLQQHNEVQEWHKQLIIQKPFYTKHNGIIHLLTEEELHPDKDMSKESFDFWNDAIFWEVPPMRNEPKSINSIICDNFNKDNETI